MRRSNNPEGRPVERSLDRVKLPCTMCGKTLKADKFAVVGFLKNRRSSWCAACTSAHQKQMYENRKAAKAKTTKKK